MTFALGRDMGIVMAKGVVIGVICCVTVLPAMILVFDKAIEKTKHKALIPSMDKASGFITKHYKVWLARYSSYFCTRRSTVTTIHRSTIILINLFRHTLASNVANEKLKRGLRYEYCPYDPSQERTGQQTENTDAQTRSMK